jgi:CPA1 family monovalent cation:H+ antiporter
MAFALAVSGTALLLQAAGVADFSSATFFVNQIDFSNVLLRGMLSFLLFAGALHIDSGDLKSVVWPVALLATVGVVIATFVTGTLVFYAAALAGLPIDYIYAVLFGALISPTDPIAVLAILKQSGISKSLFVKIGTESLFNDGVGIVAFLTILGLATTPHEATVAEVSLALVREALGGAALGLLLGWATYRLLVPIDEYRVEIMLTLALTSCGYALAEALGVSAPICIVVAGLFIGNRARNFGMSERTRQRLDQFWELIDEILNAVLFMLIGFEVVVISFTAQHVVLGAMAVAAMLIGRWMSVASLIGLMRPFQQFENGTVALLTWGGLRGGLSIAMALSLPAGAQKGIILPMTYLVVLFSILVQGLTFRRALRVIVPAAPLHTEQ